MFKINKLELKSWEEYEKLGINPFKKYNMREDKDNPNKLEYWKRVFPDATDEQLEKYRLKWGDENPKYLKFPKLEK